MLGGIIKGDLQLNKNVNKYLDMCLKCNACKDFCPSGIDAREIFISAKSEYFQKNPNYVVKAFQSKFVFNSTMKLIKLASSTYRLLKVDKIVPKFYPVFLKMGWLGKKVILANEFVGSSSSFKNTNCHSELVSASNPLATVGKIPKQVRDDRGIKLKVVYFKGCVNEFINPSVKIAAEEILARLGVEILPADFDCCGVPFLSGGNVEQFKKQAIFNLSQIPDNFDYFLTDCASCQNAFEEYKKVIDDAVSIEKLEKLLKKSLNINEFLAKNLESIEFSEKTTITFHKPCHLEDMSFLEEILTKTKNVEYVEMAEFDKCCGFSGEFAVKNPALSAEISRKKAKNALVTNADYILTTCPACKLGLVQGLIEVNGERDAKMQGCKDAKVFNLVEFIAMADEVS